MIENNVLVEHRRRGALVETREVHNVWTYYGKEYLSQIVSLQAIDDVMGDVPQTNFRVRYFGLGIGGITYSNSAYGPLFLAAYPPGFDPHGSNGHSYRSDDPTSPVVSTLERPVRRSGTANPYASAPGTDTWLFDNAETYYRDINSVTYKFVVDCTASDVVYGSFPYMPISEAGLFHSGASMHTPFSSLVAYVNFATVFLQPDSVVTFSWTVRFAT